MPIVRLFITNLDYAVEEDDLREVFREVGRPTIVNVMKDRKTQEPRGFGFVTLDTMNEPRDCWRDKLQGRKLKNRPMHIDYALPKGSKKPGDEYG